MRIYKYQVEDELKSLKELNTSLFNDYIDRITSKENRIIRTENNEIFSYYCTHCGKWHIDKKVNVKTIKKCPHCKRKYHVITKRNNIKEISSYITYIELNDRNELIIRCFYFEKSYDKENMKFSISCIEVERINYDRDIYMMLNTHNTMGCIRHYPHGYEKIKRDKRGYYGRKLGDCYFYGFVVTKGVKKIIEKTKYKYSCLDIVARKHIDIIEYLNIYRNHNELELLVKNGNFKMIREIIRGYTFPYLLENKKNLKFLKNDINLTEFSNAVKYDLNKFEDVKAYGYVNLERNENYIHKHKLNARKTCHYLYKQKHELNYYDDYLDVAKRIGMNLNDTRVLYPKNLTKAHDEVMRYYEDKKNAIITQNISEYAKELEKLSFKRNGLIIFPAKSQEELIEESKVLEHCVRKYAKNVADRKTSIFFIRKINNKNKPYVTLELKQNCVVQCRGYKNNVKSPLDKKVKQFVNEWCIKFDLKSCF